MTLPFRDIIEQAILAPNVHNVQPVRWMIEENRLVVLRDLGISLSHADPEGHDILVSVGAAIEGAIIAATTFGFRGRLEIEEPTLFGDRFTRLGCVVFEKGEGLDPLAAHISGRISWRGDFSPSNEQEHATAATLSRDGCAVISSHNELVKVAKLADDASLNFMSEKGFRRELVSWMRLKRSHPRWSLDGLNADAMSMNGAEALAASVLLGKPFDILHRLGLARMLVSEASRYNNAAGIMVVHRPTNEHPIEKGRHFYRHWLEIAKAGFVANVVASLADDAGSRNELHTLLNLPNDRRILTVFLFGKLPSGKTPANRARLPVEAILVQSD